MEENTTTLDIRAINEKIERQREKKDKNRQESEQRYIETRTLHFRFAIQIQQPVVYPLFKCNSMRRGV